MQEYVRGIQKIMPISNKNSEGEIYVDLLKGTNYREKHLLEFLFLIKIVTLNLVFILNFEYRCTGQVSVSHKSRRNRRGS